MSDNDEFQNDKAAILGRKIEELEALLEQTKAASAVSNIPVLDDLVEYEEESVVPARSPDRFTPKINLPDPKLEMPSFNQVAAEPETTPPGHSVDQVQPEPVIEPQQINDYENTVAQSSQVPNDMDVDTFLQQIEAKITHDLDTLVEILKDTIKDSVMTEIKIYLEGDNQDSTKSED